MAVDFIKLSSQFASVSETDRAEQEGTKMTLISVENAEKRNLEKANLKGDKWNIILLIYLYTLQCIPRGISLAIPLILQNRGVTYSEQAWFSLVQYSYCFKLLWAPIIDCVYSKKMGRRKTWAIPTTYMIGILLFYMSLNVEEWLGTDDGYKKPQTNLLAIVLCICIFFGTAQDVAVDGWCLTMLQKRNRGYAGICNSIGFWASTFFGFVLFIILDSKEFCNLFRPVPQDYGFVSFSNFLLFWAVLTIVSTTLLLIFKRDNSLDEIDDDSECRLGLKSSYKIVWQISKIRPVQTLCLVLFTFQMCSGVVNGVARLKLMDAGVPRDKFALLTTPSIPFVLALPFFLGRYMTGQWSITSFLASYVFRMILDVIYALFIYISPFAKYSDGTIAVWYYWLLLVIYNLDFVAEALLGFTMGAFFSQISDPRFGGIYLTLFTAASQLGLRWPTSLCLWLVDVLTIKTCSHDEATNVETCSVILDGYYTETILSTIIGVVWFYWGEKVIRELERLDQSSWRVSGNKIQEKKLLTNDQKEASQTYILN